MLGSDAQPMIADRLAHLTCRAGQAHAARQHGAVEARPAPTGQASNEPLLGSGINDARALDPEVMIQPIHHLSYLLKSLKFSVTRAESGSFGASHEAPGKNLLGGWSTCVCTQALAGNEKVE